MLEDLKRQAQSLIQKAAAAKATDKASDALGASCKRSELALVTVITYKF
jgi:hypothetical protein